MDDINLELIFEKCSLRELIILMKTCKRFYSIISELPVYKNGINELKEIYDTGIINMTYDTGFILAIANKNYSSFVLDTYCYCTVNTVMHKLIIRKVLYKFVDCTLTFKLFKYSSIQVFK